ncbi:RNA-binding domain-containing protein [Trueperella pecoris]|uniref:RNA-binding domain-containing protein n=1 Tax=Trueperella pecoris TaxID=2733571 RepID=UPI00186B94A8|nr:RNA-binding domain-containing protein [Trueperella pecoris]QOQ39762.1 AAA family ATPase [Trueperella pecoris]
MENPPLAHELSAMNLPEEVSSALRAIVEQGMTADSQESQTLDFKEDPATATLESVNPDSKLVEILLKAAICMANGNDGDSFIVLGVKDKIAGVGAIVGTERDVDWIRGKVYSGTRPGLDVGVEEFYFQGKRLLLIRIPRPLRVYSRTRGDSWYREGSGCRVMTQEKRTRLDWERRNPDFTAKPANIGEADLDLGALEHAHQLLAAKRAAMGSMDVPDTNHGLVRELGLVDGNDKLLLAGEILLARPANGKVAVRHLYYPIPGAEPRVRELNSPLVSLFGEVQLLIDSYASQEVARVDLGQGQEVPIPAFPRQAVDEVVSNALLHRDWVSACPIVIKQTPRTLTVISPGGFPPSVSESNLLTTRSVPRNPTLMNAVRRLGLAEESSRGFDRMWVSMLASGRRAPVVKVSEFDVSVTLDAGNPDLRFVQGLAAMAEAGVDIRQSVNALIVLRHLVDHPGIDWKVFAEKLQTNDLETRESVDWLTDKGIVEKVGDRIDEWVLTPQLRMLFNVTNVGATRSEAEKWVRQHLAEGAALTAREISNQLNISTADVTKLLRGLRSEGVAMIDPDGPQRGSNTRWVARMRH